MYIYTSYSLIPYHIVIRIRVRAPIIHIGIFFAMRLEITYVRTCAIEWRTYVGDTLCAIQLSKGKNNSDNADHTRGMSQAVVARYRCYVCTAFLISVIAYCISVAFLSAKTNTLSNVCKLLLLSIFLTNNLYVVEENM